MPLEADHQNGDLQYRERSRVAITSYRMINASKIHSLILRHRSIFLMGVGFAFCRDRDPRSLPIYF